MRAEISTEHYVGFHAVKKLKRPKINCYCDA